jgi:hypothetical protein
VNSHTNGSTNDIKRKTNTMSQKKKALAKEKRPLANKVASVIYFM